MKGGLNKVAKVFKAGLLLVLLTRGFHACAEENIAFVNTLEVFQQSQALQGVQKKFFQYLKEDQKFVASVEDRLRKEDQQLNHEVQRINQKSLPQNEKELSTNRLIAGRHAYEHEVAHLQEILQKRKEYLDRIFSDAQMKVQHMMISIIEEWAQKRKYTAVLTHTQVVYISANKDITFEVVQELNNRLPKITIVFESIEDFKRRFESKTSQPE